MPTKLSNSGSAFHTDETHRSGHWSRAEKQLWVITLFWSCMALYAVRMSMPLTITAIVKEYHWTRIQSGSILSSFFWGYTLTQVFGGYLSDRVGGPFVMLCATISWSFLNCWTPCIMEVLHDSSLLHGTLILLRVLLGACQGVHYPSITSICSCNLPESERTFFFSTVNAGANMGTLFIGYFGSLLLETLGWQSVFYFTGMIGLTWAMFLHFGIMRRKRTTVVPSEHLQGTNPVSERIPTKMLWTQLVRRGAFWAMIIGHVCETYSWHIQLSWLPAYFQETFPTAKAWVYNVLPWTLCIIFNIAGGWAAEALILKGFGITFVRKFMQVTSQLGKAFFLILASRSHDFVTSVTFMALAVGVSGLHSSGVLANPQDLAPGHAGTVFGLMNMAGSISGFIGVYIAGHLLATTNSWAAVFNSTAILNIIGGIVYLVYGSGKAA